MSKEKVVLGRIEVVDFPELGITGVTAKIDTGAYSTAIHTPKFWTTMTNGVDELYFQLLEEPEAGSSTRTFKTADFYKKKVRSSNGRMEERFIVKTKIKLGGKIRITHLSLTNREKMKYPVLVGRKVLSKGYLVDVSKSKV